MKGRGRETRHIRQLLRREDDETRSSRRPVTLMWAFKLSSLIFQFPGGFKKAKQLIQPILTLNISLACGSKNQPFYEPFGVQQKQSYKFRQLAVF